MKFLKLIDNQDITKYSIRIEKGEEVVSTITQFAKDNNVTFAEFSGIGAIEDVDLGVYENGQYERFEEKDLCELLSINGNISLKDNEQFLHAHLMMSLLKDGDLKYFGGHLFSATVGVTVEIFFTSYKNAKIHRRFEDACKLHVLDLDGSL